LHQLGTKRLPAASKNILVTRTDDGEFVIAAWNLVDPDKTGETRTMDLVFHGLPADARVSIQRVDDNHGNVLKIYEAMGRPPNPTPSQIEQLNRATALGAPESARLQAGRLTLTLMPNALVLVKVAATN
jgi:xylan 1,4-beta-xylosidase